MRVRAWAVAAAILGGTLLGSAGGAAAQWRTSLEWVRFVSPWVGRVVVVTVDGAPRATIEWRSRNEVRVRTESGAPLSAAGRQEVQARALVCRQGVVRDPVDSVEANGTYVIEYDCARLQ